MGVYIKGMEMPTRCYTCPCADLEFYDCNLMPRTRIEQHKRLDICPLVSVPPHGRLIDARVLRNTFCKHYSDFMDGEIDVKTALLNIEKEIIAAPTVIPAEEGE